MYDVIVIGAGVVGSLIARELSKYELKILVLEKDNDVGNQTSSSNSAIIHSGYDPKPNTLKARLNVLGNSMYDKLASELDVAFKRIGSITIAFDENEKNTLKDLAERAKENGVTVQLLNKEEVLKLEPFISDKIVAGLYAPTAGIIDPFNLVVNAMENAIDNGVELVLNENVNKIIKEKDIFTINDKYQAKIVINASGVYSDYINDLVNKDNQFKILPRKGEYIVLNHFQQPFITHTIFKVPSKNGKGVLITPTTSNNYLIGPSAELVEKDDFSTDLKTIINIKNTANMMVKNIPYAETIRTFAGVRSTPSTHDFIIEESSTKAFINVAGIESPGLASAPAIAKMVIEDILAKIIHLKEKKSFNPYVRKHIIINKLSFNEKMDMFKKNNAYGRIVCKCEKVTEGEILDALQRSCPPKSIKGLKRRLRVGFGKCQGGMCQAEALEIMANFYNVDKMKIPYDNEKSNILLNKTKEDE